MRASGTRLVALAICMAALLAAAPARGQAAAEPTAAPATFKEALAAYDAGRYAEASKLFERVYRETHEPALLFNIGQASRLMGDCARAVAYYGRFVVDAPASADRPRAEAWIAELGDCQATTPALSPPAAAPAQAAAPSPPPAPAAVPSAPPLVATPPPLVGVTTRPAGAARAARRSPLPGALLLAGAAVLGGIGGVLADHASSDSDQITQLFQNGGKYDDAAAAVDREGRRDATWAVVSFTAAVALATAGLALLLWPTSTPSGEGP